MKPAIVTGLLAILFLGTHIGLAAGPFRSRLVARIGERGFGALFTAVASVSFAGLIAYYARNRFSGAPGLALGAIPSVRGILIAAVVSGIVLMAAGSVSYAGSPYDILSHRVRSPRGIERITRHPFFAGVTMLGAAHALLATHLVGTINFSALALLAAAGAYHQDRKLLARLSEPYATYLAQTSIVPFVAIAAGRQQLVWRELPITAAAVGLVISIALRAVHDQIFAYGGAIVIAAVVGGAGIFTLVSWYQARRIAGTRHAAQVRPSSA